MIRSRLSASRRSSRVPAIVPQEELLQGRRVADERLHADADEPLERGLQLGRLALLGHTLAVRQLGLDRDPREVAQLGQGAKFARNSFADDRYAIAQRL